MTSPKPGDRIVYFTGDKWLSCRWGGPNVRHHRSRKEAVRHARRMLNDQGSGRLLVMEQTGDDGTRYRIVRSHVR